MTQSRLLSTMTGRCWVLLFLIFWGQTPLSAQDEYGQQIDAWRTAHEQRFRSPTGWLALIGHYWLKEGTNRIGSDSKFEIPLPADLDGKVTGTIRVVNGSVILESAKGSGIRVDGKDVVKSILEIDNSKPESDCESKIQIGDRFVLQLVRRNNRLAIRVRDKESQSIKDFHGKKWFAVDRDFNVEAKLTRYEPPKTIRIINIRGDESDSEIVGSLTFELQGKTYTLDAMHESGDELFILFKDSTNGDTTYSPGRFVNAAMPLDNTDNVVHLDFNKAYNPPCAFSPHTLCPLPPPQNHLTIPITAGEKRYHD